ncbi:MAG: Ig-like domain-containing protein, partial [Fidelibacterota bacterium]
FLPSTVLVGDVVGTGTSSLDGGATIVSIELTVDSIENFNIINCIATITASSSHDYAVGESAGGFILSNLPGGAWSVQVASPGDAGYYTLGYNAEVTIIDLFENPSSSLMTVNTNFNSELGDGVTQVDLLSFYVYDCAGIVEGPNVVDDCGNCVDPANFNDAMDCAGVCNGTSVIDDCGDCVLPENFNAGDLGCGCGNPAPVDYCSDWDGDGLGVQGTNVAYCEGETIPDGWVADCTDAHDDGETNVYFGAYDNTTSGTGTVNVRYDSDVDVYGFQFTVTGITLVAGGATGDPAFLIDASATTGNVIGFSLSGAFLPAGNGILATLEYEYGPTADACLSNVVISGAPGHTPFPTAGGCLTIIEPTQGCDGVYNSGLELDDCGVCDGGNADDLGCGCFLPGPADFYYDSDGDGMGYGIPQQFCDGSEPTGWVSGDSDPEPDCATNDTDDCGVCGGGNAGLDINGNCCDPVDIDDCGICYADGSSCNTPVAADQSESTDENVAVTFNLNASDPTGDDLIDLSFVSGASHGTVSYTPGATMSVTYTPEDGYSGEDHITYMVTDGFYFSNEATVTITVNAVNDPPTAVSYTVTMAEDQAINILLIGFDTDTNDDLLTFDITANPDHGTLAPVGRAYDLYTFTPDPNYNGIDSLRYTVSDEESTSDVATISLTITSVNDFPVITGQNPLSTNEDVPLTITLGDLIVTDVDNTYPDDFTLNVLSGSYYTVNGTTITPQLDWSGTLSVQAEVYDGTNYSNTFTLSVTVDPDNDDPVAGDDNYETNEDNVFSNNVLDNDSDIDGDVLTATVDQLPTHGSLSLNNDGTFTYNPDSNYNGSDSFTYSVSDGNGGSDVGSVVMTIHPINDPPTAEPVSISLASSFNFSLPANDIDGDDVTFQFLPSSMATFLGGSITADPGVENGFIYHVPSFPASQDYILYRVQDPSNLTSTYGLVTFTDIPGAVRQVSRALTVYDDTVIMNEDGTSTITLLATDFTEDISAAIVELSIASHGTLGDPVLDTDASSADIQIWTVLYTPSANYVGSDSFTYTVNSTATGTIDITINNVNDAPVITDIPNHSTNEGSEYTYDVDATDIDAGDVIT